MFTRKRAGLLATLVIGLLCVGGIGSPETQGGEPPAKADPKSAEEVKKDDQAKRLAEQWVKLIMARDVKGLLKIADVPHYTPGGTGLRVLKTKGDLETELAGIRDQELPKDLSVKITRVTTYEGGKGSLLASSRKYLDAVLRGDERLVWLESSGTGPTGKPDTQTQALIFRVRAGGIKWIGRAE